MWQTKLVEITYRGKPHIRVDLLLESDWTLQRPWPSLTNQQCQKWYSKQGYSKHCSSYVAVPDGGLKCRLWKITILWTHAQQTPNRQGKLCYHCVLRQYIGNCAARPAREIHCKHCMKWDILWPYVLVLQMSDRYKKLLMPEVLVTSIDRNSPRFSEQITTYTVNVSTVLGESQAIELMSVMSSAVSVLPKSAYLQNHWNFAAYRPEVMLSELAKALSSSAWLPACKYHFRLCSCWTHCHV